MVVRDEHVCTATTGSLRVYTGTLIQVGDEFGAEYSIQLLQHTAAEYTEWLGGVAGGTIGVHVGSACRPQEAMPGCQHVRMLGCM